MSTRASSLVLCLLWAAPLTAQSALGGAIAPHFLSRAWTSQDGLPDSRITALVAGQDGFVWIGTRRGLARFDGAGFRVFTHDNYPTLPSDEILTLALAKDSTLWVGTVTGLVRYRNGRFLPAALPPSQRNMRTTTLLALADGGMVATTTELSVILSPDTLVPGQVTKSTPQAMVQDRNGIIWALSRRLARLGQEERPDTVFSRREYERALALDSTGAVWITDINHLLVRQPAGNGRTYQAIGTEQGLPSGSIRALATAADGAVWVALDGAGVFRHSNNTFSLVPLDTVAAGSVRVLAAAADGSIWIGSNTGLNHVWPARFTTHRSGRDLARDFIWQVDAMADSSLWLATNAGGAMRLKDGLLQAVQARPPLPDRLVSATAQSHDGSIWLAFRGGGLGRWSDGRYTYLGVLPGADAVEARSMLEDRQGTLWIATGQGLYQRDGTAFRRYTEQDGLADHDIYVMRESPTGGLWLAGANALSRRDTSGHFHALIRASDHVLGGVEDLQLDGDRLWLTTFREGLALYRGGHLTVFRERVPSLLREAHRVMPDGLGFLWISSNLGLQRVRIADLLAVAQGRPVDPFVEDFDRDDGLLSAEFNSTGGASGARSFDGHLWFPSPVGLVEVDPALFRADSTPPRAVIDQVLLDDRDVTSDVAERLSWQGGRLTIRYTTPTSRKSRSMRFRYQLVGVDPGWVEAGPVREAVYPNLRGGGYTFRVQAGPGGGLWPSAPVELEVRLAPRLYEQRWFLIVMITLAAGLVAAWYRWRTRQLVLQSRRLEQLVAARTRELEASRDELDHRVQERTIQLEAELAERQRLEQQLAQASKLESVGRLAGGVAHDINNLMTAVLGYAQLAEESAPDAPGLREDLRQIRLAGERAAGVSQQLLAFGRRQIFNPRVVSLNEVLFGLDTMLRKSVGASIELVVLPGEELWNVRVDPVQIEQVIINLVSNARDAMPGGGKLWLATRDMRLEEDTVLGGLSISAGEYVELTVRDSGTGVAPDVLPHIFEPFFTTKEVGQGTGLGLATTYGIVKQSGGHIIVESDWGTGAIFRVLLPRSLEESHGTDSPLPMPAAGGSETILLVEDEPQLRALAGRFLRRIGYTVLEAADGEEALRVVAEQKRPIDAMITDLIMPRMGGLELATRMRAEGQRCRIVLVSGYVEREVPPELIRQPGVTFLAKPFRLQELARRLRTLLEGPPRDV